MLGEWIWIYETALSYVLCINKLLIYFFIASSGLNALCELSLFIVCRLEKNTTIPHVPDVLAVTRCLGKGRRCTCKVTKLNKCKRSHWKVLDMYLIFVCIYTNAVIQHRCRVLKVTIKLFIYNIYNLRKFCLDTNQALITEWSQLIYLMDGALVSWVTSFLCLPNLLVIFKNMKKIDLLWSWIWFDDLCQNAAGNSAQFSKFRP